ncbi:MAG: iron-containing alcohol dehydrogenase family protein [Methanobacteriota archaeon]
MWEFTAPHVVFGEDALAELPRFLPPAPQVLLVTDPALKAMGHADRVAHLLQEAGAEVHVFSGVTGEPDLAVVEAASNAFPGPGVNTVVAVGGGSVLDCAKAIACRIANPALRLDAINPFERIGRRDRVRLIAVPTTAGTGAEATWAIVLADPKDGRKLELASREAVPDAAILDPSLTLALPASVTAATAFDALAHALEAYVNKWRNDFTDGLSLQAARLVWTWLPVALKDPGDVEARTHLQNAACIAGLGFGNAQVGVVHSLGHAVGAVFKIPHGRCMAICLPAGLRFDLGDAEARGRLDEVARFLSLHDAERLIHEIELLRRVAKLPETLAAAGVKESEFDRNLPRLVELALEDSCTFTNPRPIEKSDIEALFREIA